jgi:hypothetical protein
MRKKMFVPADTGDRHLLAALRDRVRTTVEGTESGSFLTAAVVDGSARVRRDRRIAARAAAVTSTPELTAFPASPIPTRPKPARSAPMPVRPGLVPVFRAA